VLEAGDDPRVVGVQRNQDMPEVEQVATLSALVSSTLVSILMRITPPFSAGARQM